MLKLHMCHQVLRPQCFLTCCSEELSDEQKQAVWSLHRKYLQSLSKDNSELNSTNGVENKINVGNAKPKKEPLRRCNEE